MTTRILVMLVTGNRIFNHMN